MACVKRRVATEGLLRSLIGAAACLALGWYAFIRDEPVPLLRVIDVGSHELGRFIALPSPQTFDLMAGSIAQVLVPAGFAAYFLFAVRDRLGIALCLAWTSTSCQNVAAYIADAPYRSLQPLTGEQHEWAIALSRLHATDFAATYAQIITAVAAVLLLVAIGMCLATPVVAARRRALILGR